MRLALLTVVALVGLTAAGVDGVFAQRGTNLLVVNLPTQARLSLSSTGVTFPDVAVARASYKTTDALELFARASHVRTGDVPAFSSPIARSTQGGGAARWIVNPAVHLIGDASAVSYRRRGQHDGHLDMSTLAGASFLLARGWIQLNAARFSPGELPIVNQMLTDRQTVYAAGEFDAFARLKVFGGWEAFRSNLNPFADSRTPASDGIRGFGGVRTPNWHAIQLRPSSRARRPALSPGSRSRADPPERHGSHDSGMAGRFWHAEQRRSLLPSSKRRKSRRCREPHR